MSSRKKTVQSADAKPQPEVPVVPLTLDQIIMDLKGFGIESTEEPIVVQASGKTISMRLANVSTEDEITTLLASEEYKGHAWISRVKAEMLARSISWLNGVSLHDKKETIVVDPTNQQEVVLRIALRNIIMGWGQEITNILWKVLMVHCQKIEDRLLESLPESSIMTEVEKRFLQHSISEFEEAQKISFKEAADEIMSAPDEPVG